MNLIKYLYRQSWKLLLLATVLSILGGICATGLVAVVGDAVSGTSKRADLVWPFFGMCFLYFVAKTGSEIFLLELTQSAVLQFRTSLSRKLLGTPLKQLQSLKKHGLLMILTKDVDNFIDAFHMLPLVFGNGVIIVTCLGYMAYLSLPVFLIFFACLLICVLGYHFAERGPLVQLVRVREEMDLLYKNFRDLIEGTKELQLNSSRGRAFINGVIVPAAEKLKVSYCKGMRGYTWVNNVGSILFYIVIGVLIFLVPLFIPQRAELMVSITLIVLYMTQPITEVLASLPTLRESAIALTRIQQLDQELGVAGIAVEGLDPFSGMNDGTLRLRNVSHQYPSAQSGTMFTLGPLNLTVEQGETLFIVGGNGCGKTTLAMMLVGLYAPESGSIELNSVAVTDHNREHYRQNFSAVFADFHLFEQLLESKQSTLTERAEHYINVLQMGEKVKIVDGNFSTIELSTGQRKRLALVSSYLEDRPIYLFDEWAADQDPEFKRVFYKGILPDLKSRGKTVLVITHDDAYFSCADRVIKLEDGKIVAETIAPRAERLALAN